MKKSIFDVIYSAGINNALVRYYYKNAPQQINEYTKCQYDTNEFVYVFKNPLNNLFKIGRTINHKKRLSDISNLSGIDMQCHLLLELDCKKHEGSHIVEKYLHTFFKEKQVKSEWFSLSDTDLILIRRLFKIIKKSK